MGVFLSYAGWEGTYCDVISDDCIDNACANGATCRDGQRLYTCECPVGFTGTLIKITMAGMAVV